MNGLFLIYDDEDTAGAQALALSNQEWHVIVSGPDEGYRVLRNDDFVADYPGTWAVFASREPFQQP
jgi:hypothetical protein